MALQGYSAILEPNDPEEGYTVTVPALPGCVSCGDTVEEALENIKDAICLYIQDSLKHGETLPKDEDVVVQVTVEV
jgi:predicted RNase H-like HicB family nuclease